MQREGALAWEAALPLTLWQAAVSDDGRVYGVAYTCGQRGLWPPGVEVEDALLVVSLDPLGRIEWEHRLPRTRSPFLHGMPSPCHRGAFLQPELDRFVVRLVDAGGGVERWRAYRASTGEDLLDVRLDELQPSGQLLGPVLAARPVAGTPFVVVHWDGRYRGAPVDESAPERLALLDEDLGPVWSLELPWARVDPSSWLREARWRGESLGGDWAPHRFTLRLLDESRCLSFEVERDARGAVVVREIERAPCELEPLAPLLEAPLVALEELPARILGELDPGFAFVDSRGRVVVQDRRDLRVHVHDAEGRGLFASAPLPEIPYGAHAAALSDGSLLIELERGEHLHLAPDGALLGRPRFAGSRLAIRPGTDERWVERDDALVRLGGDGEETLRLRRGAKGGWLRWVRDLAASPSGELALLSTPYPGDAGPARIHLFDARGRALTAFPAASSIAAHLAHGGEWLAIELGSRGSYLIRRSDGHAVRLARPEGALPRSFFSPDGRELWRIARVPLRVLRYELP